MLNIDLLIKNSMKSKNQEELRAYKNLKAEIQLLKTAKNAKPYDEAAEISLIRKMVDKLSVSITQFQKAHRQDLAFECMSEREILRKLLPKPVNESQIHSELLEWCRANHLIQRFQTAVGYEECCLIPKKEMGNAIKHLKSKFPQADGKMISNIVKEYII